MGSKTSLFILDNDYNIYEMFERDKEKEGENSSYRKKITAENTVGCFYDESQRNLMVVGRNSINQIRNDGHNNFNVINGINLVGFAKIVNCHFCARSKTLSLLTSDQLVYQIKNYEPSVESCLKFVFPGDDTDHEERIITAFFYDSYYELYVVASNRSEIYLIDKLTKRQVYFKI